MNLGQPPGESGAALERAADGARPARPSPLPSGTGSAIEAGRLVNGAGLAGLAGTQLNAGYELAGQRVTLRTEGTQMAVISHDGTLLRHLPCPVPPAGRHRHGAQDHQPRSPSLQGLRDPQARRREDYRLGPRQERMNQ